MKKGINKVILLGHVGKDPEMRYMPDGKPIATFSLATSESWKDKNTGEQKQDTEWHRVVIYGGLADVCAKYVKKGSKLYIEGKNKTRKWQDKQGADHYSTEIICHDMQMLDNKQSGEAAPVNTYQQPPAPIQNNEDPHNFDDDIPF